MVTSLTISGGRKLRHEARQQWCRWSVFCAAMLFAVGASSAVGAAPGKTRVKKTDPSVYQVQPTGERIDVKVTLHKSETIRVAMPFTEALVGNADVADVVPLTDRSIYIVGRKIGVTRLALLDGAKQLLGVVDVEVTYDVDSLSARMRADPGLDHVKMKRSTARSC